MSGITNLSSLLASISPVLVPGKYTYVTVNQDDQVRALDPICLFREEEAMTVICSRELAQKSGLPSAGDYSQITLRVHSSLNAVGFLAKVASALAAADIPCNAVSAYYHDHLFVPAEKASLAMEVLSSLKFCP